MFEKRKERIMHRSIERGTRWLDGYFGRAGWLGVLDKQHLDMEQSKTCVIGQMFGGIHQTMRDNFNTIIAKGIMTQKAAEKRGFYLRPSPWLPWTPRNEDYAELTAMWVEKISQLVTERGIPSSISAKEFALPKKTKTK